MARTKGMLNLSGNLEVNAGAPLDARTVVPTAADLLVASNFQYKYVGMPVVVQATGDMYILTGNDVTVSANWKQVGSGGGGSSYTAGDGISISNDEISVKAGSNLSFDSSGNLNATDTTYTAGTNVSISNQNVISATDTTYTAGTGIDITNNVISATGGGGTSYTAGDGIDITNNVISVDEMASADMSEIIDPVPGVGTHFHTYSEDEQIVAYFEEYVGGVKGKKPIYEKMIVNYIPSASTGTVLTINATDIDPNIKMLFDYKVLAGWDYTATGIRTLVKELPLVNGDGKTWMSYNEIGIFAEHSTNYFRVNINVGAEGAGSNRNYDIYFIAQYTKTTD